MAEQERILPPENMVQFKLEPGEQLEVALAADGMVTLYLRPMQRPSEPPLAQEEPALASVEPETPAPLSSTEPATAAEQPRLTVRGIVGAAPAFWTTKRGVEVGHFPLARHEAGDTAWLHALVFYNPQEVGDVKRERARKLMSHVREQVDKGHEVTVVGYPHQRLVQRGGKQTAEEQLYVTAVRHHKTRDKGASSPTPPPTSTSKNPEP